MGRQAADLDFADGQRDALVVWVPAIVGLGLLAGLLLAVLAWTPAGSTRSPVARQSTSPAAAPPVASAASSVQRPSVGGDRTTLSPPRNVPVLTPSPARSAVSQAPRTVPPADVTGRYRVVDSYRTGFIGEILISNASRDPRPWTVRLIFSSDVGALHTFWVESQPQATLQRSGHAYIFSGSVPVAARSSVVLRFQFDRWGWNIKPLSCSTNGLTCAGL